MRQAERSEQHADEMLPRQQRGRLVQNERETYGDWAWIDVDTVQKRIVRAHVVDTHLPVRTVAARCAQWRTDSVHADIAPGTIVIRRTVTGPVAILAGGGRKPDCYERDGESQRHDSSVTRKSKRTSDAHRP